MWLGKIGKRESQRKDTLLNCDKCTVNSSLLLFDTNLCLKNKLLIRLMIIIGIKILYLG